MDSRRMCPHCRAFITDRDKVCPYCGEKVGPRAIDRREPGAILGGFIPHARFVTMLIITICVGLYLATVVFSQRAGTGGGFMSIDGQTLLEFGAKYRAAILVYGQWWRLVTAGFLHGGLLHIGMNMWVLFDLGAQVEDVYGGARLIVFFFVATVFGFLASTFWSPALSVGAALRGMYIRWAVYVLIFGLLPGFNIDNAAHIGGLAAGFVVAYVAGTPRIAIAWNERLWLGAASVCVVLTAGSFLMMYLWFSTTAQ
jgi:rhomboid protease GluP